MVVAYASLANAYSRHNTAASSSIAFQWLACIGDAYHSKEL
jgi:hypothetical protein